MGPYEIRGIISLSLPCWASGHHNDLLRAAVEPRSPVDVAGDGATQLHR